ncbi:MAG: matrixin family metalloprotease [Nocardioides sp.]
MTVLSIVITAIVLAGYLAFSDSAISTRLRALVGVEDRFLPPVDSDTTGPFAFLNTQPGSGRPVGFSPCAQIRYVVNPTSAPSGWEQHVEQAINEVSARTGLEFDYEGTTDDRDFSSRARSGTGSADPVIIAWADEDEVDDLADDVAGVGGPTMVSLGRLRAYVSGSVVLDTDATDRFSDDPNGDALQVALLLHELGHLVGLDHVDDATELMYADGITRPDYGPGDRAGLAELGAIPCRA